MIVTRRIDDGYGTAIRTHTRGEMSVDDVEELADRIHGKLVHSVERDAAVAARKCVERVHGGGEGDDEGAAVRIEALRYRDIGGIAFPCGKRSGHMRIVGESREKGVGVCFEKIVHCPSTYCLILVSAAVISSSA